MNFRYIRDENALLKAVIAQNPRASLDEIQKAHPSFQFMSLDHLGLRLQRLFDGQSQTGAA